MKKVSYLRYPFVLILAINGAVFHENVAFSIIVVSTTKRYSSFLKMGLIFQKVCFKVRALKLLKIFSDFQIKISQSLERRVILKTLPFFTET